MSVQDLKTIRERLAERKRALEEELMRLSQEQFSDGQVQDPGDQALSSAMDSLRNSLQNTEQEEYARIVKAIEMIDAGTYGMCVDCDLPISERRLSLYPNAARCLPCQETFEEAVL